MNDKELEAFRAALVLEQMDKVEKFLAKKPDLEQPFPRTGHLPLYEVALRKDTTLALERLLAAGANPNGVGAQGQTALQTAVIGERVKVVAALILAGGDVNHRKKDDYNSLLGWAAFHDSRKSLDILRQLLAAGAQVNPDVPLSPLMQAACRGSVEMLRALVAAGADINYRNARFGTALFMAVKDGRHDSVEFLLSAGADPTLTLPAGERCLDEDFVGKTALEMATALKKKKVIAAFAAANTAAAGGASPAESPTPDVAQTWKALDKWLKKHNPGMKKSLAKGAGDKAFASLEKLIGQKLPDDFHASYEIYDGQKEAPDDGLIPPTDELDAEYKLLSLEECAAEWQMLKKLHADGEFTRDGSPDAGVATDWWNPGWLPFASDGGGDSLCLDLAPAQGGQQGQIISCPHDDSRRRLLAGSFAAWLADLAERITASEE